MAEKNPDRIDADLKRIGQLIAERKGEGYEVLRARLCKAREIFHAMLANCLEGPLNERLASLPRETLEDKRAIANLANADMRLVGVAARCPKTGQPAKLTAAPSGESDSGRFQIELLAADSHRKRTQSSTALPQITLMGCPLRLDATGNRWASRLSDLPDPGKKKM